MLALSGADRALVTFGPVTVGVLLALILPPVARWFLGLGVGLPFGVVFKVVARIDAGWEVAVQAGILGGLGLLATAELLRRSIRVTVAEEELRLEAAGEPRTVPRADIVALFWGRKDFLVVLDRDSREIFHGEPGARAHKVERTFRDFGYPWHDGDPFADLYQPWEPGSDRLPAAVDAVLRARAVALRQKAEREAGELRDSLQQLGYAVRDDGEQQFWRPLVRS